MREETRRAAVYIAATKVAAKQKGLVYDHDRGRHTVMSGDSSHAFDHEARAHIWALRSQRWESARAARST